MQVDFVWQGKIAFAGGTPDHKIALDTVPPLGTNTGMSPKQLLLAAVCGCTGMDVAALFTKHRQTPESFRIRASGQTTTGYPSVFKEILVEFMVTGPVDAQIFTEAVTLSQTKYCGVSAMVAAVSPIRWIANLNGVEIAQGHAQFPALTQ
jgi:putative redox protein